MRKEGFRCGLQQLHLSCPNKEGSQSVSASALSPLRHAPTLHSSSWDNEIGVQDLLARLLERKPARRLGMLNGLANDVKNHPWFSGIDWIALAARKVETPRQPKDDSAKRLRELQVLASPLIFSKVSSVTALAFLGLVACSCELSADMHSIVRRCGTVKMTWRSLSLNFRA